MMLVCRDEYSEAPWPSRCRAAPAKYRRLSRLNGISLSAASLTGLPVLRDSNSAISPARDSSRSAIFQRDDARALGVVLDHASNASFAAATAPFTSAAPALGTVA